MSTTLGQLCEVFQNVFQDDEISISCETTAKDITGWDSLMHVTLIIAVERAFDVRFSSAQVAGLKSVGELADLIDRKRAA